MLGHNLFFEYSIKYVFNTIKNCQFIRIFDLYHELLYYCFKITYYLDSIICQKKYI